MTMKKIILIIVFSISYLCSNAQSNTPVQKLFNEGYKSYNAGRYSEAVRSFLKAKDILGAANTVMSPYLIRSLVVIKNWPQAKTELDDYFDLPRVDTCKDFGEMKTTQQR